MPLISSDNEIENTLIITKFKPLNSSSDMIGKASLYLNAINSIGDSDVRISKRNHIPYSRLRGFEKGKIGPIDSGDFMGGNYVATLNLSTKLPKVLSKIEIIDF